MRRAVLRRLVAAMLVLVLACLVCLLLLHDQLASLVTRPPHVDDDILALYNHVTRTAAPKPPPTLPRPQIHLKKIPPPAVHINMTSRQIEYQFFSFLEHKSVRCENDIRLGNINDGGWNVCMSPPYTLSRPCIIFSFGIGYDWQFDDSVSKIYGCRVLAFDPSMSEPDSRRSPLIEFRQMGIGPRNEVTDAGWRLKTLGTHLKDEGYWGMAVDYVKIDIEYFEWEVLRTAIEEGALKHVKQLGFEAHSRHFLLAQNRTERRRVEELWRRNRKSELEMEEKLDFVHMYETIRKLEILNFRKFNYRKNPFGNYRSNLTKKEHSSCYDLHFVNTDYLLDNQTVIHSKDSGLFH